MPDIECRSRCRPSSPAAAFLPAGQRPLTTAPHFCELTGRTNYGLSKDLGRISRRRCRGGSSVVPSRPAGPTRVRQFVPALVSRRAKPTAGDGCADGVAGDPAKRTCVGKIDGGGEMRVGGLQVACPMRPGVSLVVDLQRRCPRMCRNPAARAGRRDGTRRGRAVRLGHRTCMQCCPKGLRV